MAGHAEDTQGCHQATLVETHSPQDASQGLVSGHPARVSFMGTEAQNCNPHSLSLLPEFMEEVRWE